MRFIATSCDPARVWLAWLVCLISGLFFFPSAGGVALFGIALALHAWMIFHAAAEGSIAAINLAALVDGAGIDVGGLSVLSAYRKRRSGLGFGAATTMAWPAYGCEQGDYLLTWRTTSEHSWRRGDLAVCHYRRAYNQTVQDMATITAGQIVGLPGESLTIEQGRFD